jgi:hypothetical protein
MRGRFVWPLFGTGVVTITPLRPGHLLEGIVPPKRPDHAANARHRNTP